MLGPLLRGFESTFLPLPFTTLHLSQHFVQVREITNSSASALKHSLSLKCSVYLREKKKKNQVLLGWNVNVLDAFELLSPPRFSLCIFSHTCKPALKLFLLKLWLPMTRNIFVFSRWLEMVME